MIQQNATLYMSTWSIAWLNLKSDSDKYFCKAEKKYWKSELSTWKVYKANCKSAEFTRLFTTKYTIEFVWASKSFNGASVFQKNPETLRAQKDECWKKALCQSNM